MLNSQDGLDGLLARAREGDAAAREMLLKRYAPFALKVASRTTGGFVELGRDDEGSVALLAFNEAIDHYDPTRGASFLGFVRTVIRRRLIDHYRRGRTERAEVPMGDLAAGDGRDGAGYVGEERASLRAAEARAAERAYQASEDSYERREEIVLYREMLAVYGISTDDLVRSSPRHEDARRRAVEVARRLAASADLLAYLRRRGELPLADLERITEVSRKTLERHRKYIIAVTLILTEDLPHLKEYIR